MSGPRYRVQRPDGTAWTRTPDGTAWTGTFAFEAAAWRVVVGGCNSERERRVREAEMQRAGWRVALIA